MFTQSYMPRRLNTFVKIVVFLLLLVGFTACTSPVDPMGPREEGIDNRPTMGVVEGR